MIGHGRNSRRRGHGAARVVALVVLLPVLTVMAGRTATAAQPAGSTVQEVRAATQVAAPVPQLNWRPCRAFPGVQCASAMVPLDYDEPLGTTTRVGVLRVPAINPEQRIGTIFVNPGGPGGTARDFAAFVTALLPPNVSRSFDVVGVDPRGTDAKTPAVCRSGDRRPAFPSTPIPLTEAEIRDQLRYSRWISRACKDRPAPIVDHLSTADVARDMDLVRQAQGDEQLNYVGLSYGTYLGATYAAMFPDRVRAMVLDGVLDPVDWATGTPATGRTQPFSRRIGSGDGAWRAMRAALAECDRVGLDRCAFAGDALGKWKQLTRRLRVRPFTPPGEGQFPITYGEVIGGTTGALYDVRSVRFLMSALDRLHDQMFGDRPSGTRARATGGDLARDRERMAAQVRRVVRDSPFGRVADPFSAIACADTDNPDDVRDWVTQARRADLTAPGFGAFWTWVSSPCAGWSRTAQEDRYTGPFTITTTLPALVVANSFDPATPIAGARELTDLWSGSRLLELETWGHVSLSASPCVDLAYAAYLLRGELPAAGTTCRPTRPLFKE